MATYRVWTIRTLHRFSGEVGRPFVAPRGRLIAFVYGDEATLAAVLAHWPQLTMQLTSAYAGPGEDDYALPAGTLRLYLDLCETFGEPT